MQMLNSGWVDRISGVVRQCGLTAKQLAAQGFEIYQKAPNDYVTDVDHALDRQLSEAFSHLFPEDSLVTEENPASPIAFQHRQGRTWCIDPLDGTQDFMNGDPDYAVMVGALLDTPQAGWIYAPEHDLLYYGGPAIGLWQSKQGQAPEPLQATPPSQPHRIIIGDKDLKNYGERLSQAIATIDFWPRPGSFGLKMLEVLQGNAGLYVYFNRRVKVWDTVAPLAIAEAAGLRCCDLEGQSIGYTSEVINPHTLAHKQAIIIGWPAIVESLLPQLAATLGSASPSL